MSVQHMRAAVLLTCFFVGCEDRLQISSEPSIPQFAEIPITFSKTASTLLTLDLEPDGPDWHMLCVTDPELPRSCHLTELRFDFVDGTIQATFVAFGGDEWLIEFKDHKSITDIFDGKPRRFCERVLLELKQSYGNNALVR